jgi:hypothetical protein
MPLKGCAWSDTWPTYDQQPAWASDWTKIEGIAAQLPDVAELRAVDVAKLQVVN